MQYERTLFYRKALRNKNIVNNELHNMQYQESEDVSNSV